jgi:hypothetical protein
MKKGKVWGQCGRSTTWSCGGLALLMLGVLGISACSGADSANTGGSAGGGGSGSGGVTSGGSAGAAQHAGTSAGGSAGSVAATGGTGGVGGGPVGPPVPRVENTDGESALDKPVTSLSDGKCAGQAVFCGECLASELQVAGNCTALKLGLGQMTSLALTTDALFYTSANREIVKLDLAKGTHQSLVRGLEFVKALVVDGSTLYFSTETPDSFFEYDARGVALSGGDVTVLSHQALATIGIILPLPDKLLLGIGDFDFDLMTIPKGGGYSTSFGGLTGVTTPLLAGSTLYYRSNAGLSSTSIDAPAPDHHLNREFSNATIILEGDYLYYIESGAYTRTPTAGGASEVVQMFDNAGVWGRTPDQVIIGQTDANDDKILHLLTMPIKGGTPKDLVTLESGELQAVAGNATELYLAVGSLHGGGLLKVKL